MKKILFLQIYGGGEITGGTEVYLKNLLKELSKISSKNNYFVTTFNKNDSIFSPYARVEDSNFTRFLENWKTVTLSYKFPLLGFFNYLWGIYWLYKISCKIIAQEKIDLIYSNGGNLTAIVAFLLYKKYKVPYILHFHGLFNFQKQLNANTFSWRSLLFKKITKNSFLQATRLIANSKEVADDINSIEGIDKKAEVINCFTDTDVFFPQNQQDCRKKLKLHYDQFIFLSSNRLDRNKGIDSLMQAIPLVKNNNITFIFIGDGELKTQIVNLAKHDKRIKYFPPINNETLSTYNGAADIVWGAASTHYIGLSIIEALACGRPIMALKTPLPADNDYQSLVDPNTIPSSVGYLVDANPLSFVKLLEQLIEHRDILETKTENCLKFYHQQYGSKNINKIMKILYNVVQSS